MFLIPKPTAIAYFRKKITPIPIDEILNLIELPLSNTTPSTNANPLNNQL
jgi:hypothetical protein